MGVKLLKSILLGNSSSERVVEAQRYCEQVTTVNCMLEQVRRYVPDVLSSTSQVISKRSPQSPDEEPPRP